jgi:acyl carrier protein
MTTFDPAVLVRTILHQVSGQPFEEIDVDTRITDLGIDSVDLGEVVARIEETVGADVPFGRWLTVRTVGDVITIVSQLRPRRPAMSANCLPFIVTDLDVDIVETIPIRWQGREIDSGPIHISLGASGSSGVIDYDAETVEVEFRSQIRFPELAETLEEMGADPGIYAPVEMVIRSTGAVLEGHCLRLAGVGTIDAHRLFDPRETRVDVRAPSRCKPDLGSGSGEEIREALRTGKSVSWNFNPAEKRVALTLPESLGGATHQLSLSGSYTLTAAEPDLSGA